MLVGRDVFKVAFLVFTAVFVISCSSGSQKSGIRESNVKVAFKFTSEQEDTPGKKVFKPADIVRLRLVISADDADTKAFVYEDINSGSELTDRTVTFPKGKDRIFHVAAYNKDNVVVMEGEKKATLKLNIQKISVLLNSILFSFPEILLTEEVDVNVDSAKLRGRVNSHGLSSTAWFEWGRNSSFSNKSEVFNISNSVDGFADVGADLNGLAQGTEYDFRLVVDTYGDIVTSVRRSFTTLSQQSKPSVRVDSISTTEASATINVKINPQGLESTAYLKWGLTDQYLDGITGEITVPASGLFLPASFLIPDLLPFTSYHYMIIAQNRQGETESGDGIFSTQNNLLNQWGDRKARFSFPNAAAVDNQGNIYIADTAFHRIQKLDADGNYIFEWGSRGSLPGQFNEPTDIEIGPDGGVYVLDSGNSRVQKFDADGNYILSIEHFAIHIDNVSAEGDLDQETQTGQEEQQPETVSVENFSFPFGMAFDNKAATTTQDIEDNPNGIYIADTGNHRVIRLKLESNFSGMVATDAIPESLLQVLIDNGLASLDTANPSIFYFDKKIKTDARFNKKLDQIGVNDDGTIDISLVLSDSEKAQATQLWLGSLVFVHTDYKMPPDETLGFSFPSDVTVSLSGDVLYIADSENSRVIKFSGSGVFEKKWGISGSLQGRFIRPQGIVTNSAGTTVYVSDTGNHRIQKFDENGDIITVWGQNGGGDNDLYSPRGITIDSQGYIYIADTNNHRIQKFDENGQFILSAGTQGLANGQFILPQALAISNDNHIYVGDTYNNRIQVFDLEGNFLFQWGKEGSGDDDFSLPKGLTVSDGGEIFVVDSGNNRISVFDSNGLFKRKWGQPGTGDGFLRGAKGIAVSGETAYIVDSDNHRIQKFDKNDGAYIGQFGKFGFGDGQFNFPWGIVMDKDGNIYVTDTGNNRIQKFDKDGAFIESWDEFNLIKLLAPKGITIDSSSNIYVADTGNHRILILTSDGNFISEWGTKGAERHQFLYPTGIAVFDNGDPRVYIADSGNDRISMFGR